MVVRNYQNIVQIMDLVMKLDYNNIMEKLMGFVLLILAVSVSFYIATHLSKLNNITIPVPDSVVKYFKVDLLKK